MISPEAVLRIEQESGEQECVLILPLAGAGGASGVALLAGGGSNPNPNTTLVGGDTAGQTIEDSAATLTASGTLTVSDAEAGQAVFVAQAATAGSNGFGTFTLGTGGGWTYEAINAQSAIQTLGAGQALTDSFTAITADGTTQIVTVTIMGVNDAAVISGVTTGSVAEDTGSTLTASGALTVSDADAGQAVFVAQSATAGANGYGTFTLGPGGGWTYAASNAQSAIQTLGAGQALTDSFTAVTAEGTTQIVTVTIMGVNDAAVIGGVTTGSVAEDTGSTLTASGALTVSDADAGQAVFVAQAATAGTNGYGTFTLGPGGGWTYAASNAQSAIQTLLAGQALTDSFTTVTADGATQIVTVTITGVTDNAVIGGVTTGSVAEDTGSTLTASGALTVSDADAGQAVFVPQAATAGTNGYGTFTLGPGGGWTYAAINAQSAIQTLGSGQALTDSFTAVTADGTTQIVTVTITGVRDAIELSAVEAGTGGFVINGVSAGDMSGFPVSSAGDVNGDGLDDLIIGAVNDDPNGSNSGASFVVFGKTGTGVVQLSDIESGTGGFVINGVSAGDQSGISVSSAGDVNGDGLDDLIIGARYDEPNGSKSGASFVVFGKTGTGAVQLSDVESGAGGFVINGVSAFDQSGFSVSSAGDVNGDGLDDLIIGAPYDDPNGSASGTSFVVFGKTGTGVVQLSDIEAGTGGFVINGLSAFDQSGRSVSSAGDVNSDGFDDLIIGARYDDPNGVNSGASFVVFGKTGTGAVQLSDIEAGTGGFVINGVSAGDLSGWSVSSAGDVNGDGFDDLIIGAPYDRPNGFFSGASFVVFGKTGTGAVQLSDIEAGIGGFVINGVSASDRSGWSVSSAGDVNGDGLDDLIIGAIWDDPNGVNSGASFVVFGKTGTGAVQLSNIEAGIGGFVINGVSAFDESGFSVSSAGDVNGDGFDDLIIGAPFDDPNGGGDGASFVVFGGNFTVAATQLGTLGADSLSGSSSNDAIFAGLGNDTLSSEGGTDRLSGGAGADRFVVTNDAGTVRILDFDGGEGDRIDLSAFGIANFAAAQTLVSAEGPGGHDSRITLDADTIVILDGVAPSAIVASHLIL